MTYRELWRTLEPLYGNGEARAVTDYVLDVCFGLSKADILCGAVEEMTAEKTAELNKIFGHLTEGEPVQYVLGRAEFCGRWFSVRPGVLIPRPETEELCAWITADSKASASPKVLDIGTGSGCIAITLQLDMPESKVTAWDISADALDVARENAQQLGANVNFVRQDALNAKPEGEWDVIVSNPPYICEKEKKDMAVNVLEHEPHTALFVPDADPLLFYRAITRLAVQTLNKGGRLYFEINPIYADDTCHMMRAEGMTAVELRSDMYGKQRMAKGVKA
ncbi:MAG: peptide chain release factor N(5)-glutamine methyltransferase [Xylanibacter rarus]